MIENEKVILIKGDNSKWYAQAIFIMNNNSKANATVDFVQEAEKIINSYMLNKKYKNPKAEQKTVEPVMVKTVPASAIAKKKSSRDFDILLNACMLVCCLIMAVVVGKMIFI